MTDELCVYLSASEIKDYVAIQSKMHTPI